MDYRSAHLRSWSIFYCSIPSLWRSGKRTGLRIQRSWVRPPPGTAVIFFCFFHIFGDDVIVHDHVLVTTPRPAQSTRTNLFFLPGSNENVYALRRLPNLNESLYRRYTFFSIPMIPFNLFDRQRYDRNRISTRKRLFLNVGRFEFLFF